MRPISFDYRPKRTAWLDYKTGRGVTDSGASIRPKVGERRKFPNLADLLDTAHAMGAERIMLTGAVPEVEPGDKGHWLIVKTPGWKASGHWLNKPVTGRFVNEVSGEPLEVRTVEEWFSTSDLSPMQARDAWDVTARVLADAIPHAVMALTPASTGANAWALSLPKTIGGRRPGGKGPVVGGEPFELEPLPKDIAEELHFTAGQHRVEHLTTGPDRCDCGDCLALFDAKATPQLETFSYVDGRFMYAACCRELGTMPAHRLNGAAAADLLDRDPYARARYYVRFTIPDGWQHVGLLGVKRARRDDGWHYPNRPGTTFETWADAVEVKTALDAGWFVQPLEGVTFRKSRVLDTFADRMTRARERVNARPDIEPQVRRAVAAALRSMLIQTIGNFASRLRGRTVTVWSIDDVPQAYEKTVQRYGDAFTYEMPGREHNARELAFYRPELAAQVWARARSRVLLSPLATPTYPGGVLAMDPATLIGINGDAIYSSVVPNWAQPVDQPDGGDDGRVGRLRLKGVLHDVPTPLDLHARNELRAKAEAAGVPGWESDV
ncbi:hypothetical protein ACQFYA_21080 [Promicromonospora sp. Marseille-Q5078]